MDSEETKGQDAGAEEAGAIEEAAPAEESGQTAQTGVPVARGNRASYWANLVVIAALSGGLLGYGGAVVSERAAQPQPPAGSSCSASAGPSCAMHANVTGADDEGGCGSCAAGGGGCATGTAAAAKKAKGKPEAKAPHSKAAAGKSEAKAPHSKAAAGRVLAKAPAGMGGAEVADKE